MATHQPPMPSRELITTLAKLIAEIIERMPRSDPEAVALRILGSLDQAGYEVWRKPSEPQIVGVGG